MKLNDEQRRLVEDNHNLIYGFIHKRGLNVDNWYDIIAIELCKTIMDYNPDRGAMSTYFYMRCDSKVKNMYRRSNAKKRTHNGIVNLEEKEYTQIDTMNHRVEELKEQKLLQDLLEDNPENAEMLLLLYEGYTQYEVADMIGMSQAQVSRRLKKIKRRFIDND